MAVLLRGNAVNYAVAAQDPAGIVIGKLSIEHPIYHKDLLKMQQAGGYLSTSSERMSRNEGFL